MGSRMFMSSVLGNGDVTPTRPQRDASRPAVAARKGISGVFRECLKARGLRLVARVSRRSNILVPGWPNIMRHAHVLQRHENGTKSSNLGKCEAQGFKEHLGASLNIDQGPCSEYRLLPP